MMKSGTMLTTIPPAKGSLPRQAIGLGKEKSMFWIA